MVLPDRPLQWVVPRVTRVCPHGVPATVAAPERPVVLARFVDWAALVWVSPAADRRVWAALLPAAAVTPDLPFPRSSRPSNRPHCPAPCLASRAFGPDLALLH